MVRLNDVDLLEFDFSHALAIWNSNVNKEFNILRNFIMIRSILRRSGKNSYNRIFVREICYPILCSDRQTREFFCIACFLYLKQETITRCIFPHKK